jgi:hypothetical protein
MRCPRCKVGTLTFAQHIYGNGSTPTINPTGELHVCDNRACGSEVDTDLQGVIVSVRGPSNKCALCGRTTHDKVCSTCVDEWEDE